MMKTALVTRATCLAMLAAASFPAQAASKPASCKPRPEQTADTAQVIASIEALGGVGQAAPNAEAQAVLDKLAALMNSRDDADSKAAAAMLRRAGAGATAAAPEAGKPTDPSRCP